MTDASPPPTFSGDVEPPPVIARSEPTRSAYSWRKPGRWRLAYGIPWVTLALLLVVATVESPPTWLGDVTVGSILATAALVSCLALLPALGFVFIRRRGGLVLVAVLGIVVGVVLFLAAGAMYPSQSILSLIVIAFFAAVAASIIAIVVLFIVSHETPPPSEGGWWDGDIPSLDGGD